MKTPIVYYGGKTAMLKHVLPLIPEGHRSYVEPFIGGAAVLFGKPAAKIEVINDNLDLVTNFYQVVRDRWPELESALRRTLHSENAYATSKTIIQAPVELFDPVFRAWAFWVQCNMTFGHKMSGGFAFGQSGFGPTTAGRIDQFTGEVCKRLRHVQIFNRDALDVIRRFDGHETFFYLDPPYANSDCGHYNKGKDVYYRLLLMLPDLKGKWLLSSYPTPELEELWKRPGVHHQTIDKPLGISGKLNAGKRKTETLTWNY